ncbi:MAG TPA: ATP-binding protein [Flavipsychrobacter sp.]|nr:ATP-binding protein [Flavipsychrobacter sp.]
MDQVVNFFKKLVDTQGFPPRWHCGTGWDEFTGWLYILSDLMVWGAYFAIPIVIIRYITSRHDVRFTRIYFLFASFILACGTTHLIDAILFWHPVYRLSALVRFITAIVSWTTVFFLFKLLPRAFSLKTAKELETEVEHRKKAEEELKMQNAMLNEAHQLARMGYWQWNVKEDKIIWSDNLYKIFHKQPTDAITYGYYLNSLHPEDRDFVNETITAIFQEKKFEEFYHRILLADGSVRTIHSKGSIITNDAGDVIKMVGTAQDVTEQKKVEQELLSKTQDLEASNIELQKFASIASHDLREPLRKILTFTSMLEKEVTGPNEKARVYTEKIVNSAARMQQLIDDILDFSRLSASDIVFEKVNLNQIIDQVLSDIEVNITVANAVVKVDNLPSIEANASQLGQLFQNLISNAIKFRKEGDSPVVNIHSEIISGVQLPMEYLKGSSYCVLSNPKFWAQERFVKIYVQDNGIGFEESYVDKIFMIFQRLHSRSDYEGTGIGLAICKKVVDIHHGTISAKSQSGEGATFVVILPLSQRNFRGSENHHGTIS